MPDRNVVTLGAAYDRASCRDGSTTAEASVAADMWHGSVRSLALADRACLAPAQVRGLPVVTVDRAWTTLALGVEVRTIR